MQQNIFVITARSAPSANQTKAYYPKLQMSLLCNQPDGLLLIINEVPGFVSFKLLLDQSRNMKPRHAPLA